MNDQILLNRAEIEALKKERDQLSGELKEMQLEVQQIMANIKEFFLLGSGGKVIFSHEGIIEEVNGHFVEGMNVSSKSQLINCNLFDLVIENDLPLLQEAIKKLTDRQSANLHLIIGMHRFDGTQFDASVSLTGFNQANQKDSLYFASITNITSQLNMHYELEEKTKLLQEAQKLSSFGYWNYSYTTKRIFWSDEVYHIFEIDKSQDISTLPNIIQHIHPSDHEKMYEFWEANTHKQQINEVTVRVVVPDGSVKYVYMKAEIEKDRNHRPLRILGTIVDITENWYRERKIIENEELFHSLFSNLTDIYIIFELEYNNEGDIIDYIYKDVNPLYEMKVGFMRNEVIGKRFSKHLPSVFNQFKSLFRVSAIASQPQQDRLYIQMLDTFFDVLIYSPAQNMLATIWRDVSLMVEAESSLRESEEKYRQIFSIASDALFMADFQTGRILETNPTATRMYGFSRDELLSMSFLDLSFEPEKLKEFLNAQVSTLANEVCIKKDNLKFPVEISLAYFNWNGRKVIFISVRDITERIISQEQLIKSEQKFKQLFDFSNDAILILRNYRIIDFNQKASQLFDTRHSSLVNKTLWSISPGYQSSGEDSRMNAVELLQDTLSGSQHQVEWVFQRNDLTTFVADVKLSPILYGNEKVIQAIIRDITPQKETEIALKNDAERWKFALEGSSTGVWDWDIPTNHIYYSPAWKAILGYQDHELPNLFEEFEKRIHPKDATRVFDYINQYLSGKINSFLIEFRIQCKNGSYKWILSRGKITSYSPDGRPSHFIGTHDDITRTKIIEQNYLNEINKLKQTASMLKTGYWELDLRTMIFHGTPQAFKMLGFDDEPLYLKKLEKVIHPDDKEIFINLFTSHNPSKSESLESFRILLGNETRHIQSYVLPQFDSANILTGYIGAFQDITIHKTIETEQESKNNILKALSGQMHLAILIIQNEQIVFSNKKASDLFGYSEQKLQSIEFSFYDLIAPSSRDEFHWKIIEWSDNKSKSNPVEVEIITKNQRIKWVEVTAAPLLYQETGSVILIFSDITAHKVTMTELRNRLNLLQQIFDKSEGGVAVYSREYKLIDANPKYHSLLGELSGLSKKNDPHSILKDNEKTIVTLMQEFSQQTDSIFHQQINLQNENDHNWIDLFIQQLSEDRILIYIQEIDQFKHAENSASRENEILRHTLESQHHASAIFDEINDLVYSNQLFDKQFISVVQDQDFNLSLLPFTSNPHFQDFLFQFQKGISSRVTFQFEELNGLIFQIEGRAIQVDTKRYLILTIIDETLIRNEISRYKSGLEKFHAIFESSPLGLAIIDKNRNIVQVNPAYAQILDYSPQELETKKMDDFIPIDHLQEALNNYFQLFSGVKSHYTFRQPLVRKGDKILWVRNEVYAAKDQFGNIMAAINVLEDISGQIDSENKNAIRERYNTLQIVSDSMAHLFNNQFMSIFGSAYLLKSYSDDILIESYANNIISAMQRWFDQSQKFMFFATHSRNLHIVVDIHQVIREIRNSELLNSFPDVSVKYQFESVQGKIIGDPNQLYSILHALMFNAIESLTTGGTIRMSTQDVFFEKDEASNDQLAIKSGRYTRIRIADSGVGINPKIMPYIFDPFFTTKKNPINPGLGLTLCKLLITKMGGYIKIFSELGIGTETNIYLPIPESEKLQKYVIPNEQILIKGSANIMLIDDEEVIRIITSKFLQKLGYNVFSFSSGESAIRFYQENKTSIDLIILDMQMPVMNGDEVFRQLKAISPNVVVILMSGFNLDERIENLLKEGVVAFIQKPVGIEKLSQAISKVLNSKKSNVTKKF